MVTNDDCDQLDGESNDDRTDSGCTNDEEDIDRKINRHNMDLLREMRENMDKKEWKKFVKEQNKEKRENKIPKKVKEKYSKKKK